MVSKASILLLAAMAVVGVLGQPNQCVSLGGRLLSTCQQELDFLQKIYPLNSNVAPTAAQIKEVEDTKPSGLPSATCCTAVKAFDAQSCSCDTSLPTLLGTLGLDVSTAGLQGVSAITGPLCDYTPHTC